MSIAAPPHRLSSGVVVVSLVQRKLNYLLLRAYRNWDFPKGLVEPGEQPIDAALREVREETSLDDLSFDWGLEYMETGPYNKGKISRYYIARSKQMQVSLPINPDLGMPEHHEACWGRLPQGVEHGIAAPAARGRVGSRRHQSPAHRQSPAEKLIEAADEAAPRAGAGAAEVPWNQWLKGAMPRAMPGHRRAMPGYAREWNTFCTSSSARACRSGSRLRPLRSRAARRAPSKCTRARPTGE